MSNYVKTVDFAAKDPLAHGNSLKIAKGAEVDTEFNNIATAITSKQDTSSKGIANGYAGLDVSALVPVVNIPSLPASQITSGTFTTGLIPSLPASQITSGTFSTARLGSGSATSSVFLRGDSTWSTIAAGNVSGLANSATTDTTNASNISGGTLSSARLAGGVLRHGSLGSGTVTVQSGGSASGGSDGDIFLIY